jgi:hypothetical protein
MTGGHALFDSTNVNAQQHPLHQKQGDDATTMWRTYCPASADRFGWARVMVAGSLIHEGESCPQDRSRFALWFAIRTCQIVAAREEKDGC